MEMTMDNKEILKRIDRIASIIEKDATKRDNKEKASEIRSLVKLLEQPNK